MSLSVITENELALTFRNFASLKSHAYRKVDVGYIL